MLKYQLLHPEILRGLGEAGHGAQVLVADGNYPLVTRSYSGARRVYLNLAPDLVRVTDVLRVLSSAIPIEAAQVMQPESGDEPPVFAEFRTLLPGMDLQLVGRFEFYDAARGPDLALAIATGECRIYANILLTIGVVPARVPSRASGSDRMTLLTCIGEALIDFLPIEEDGRTVGFRMYPGGSLLNVAVAAARLSQPVALASKLSTDFFGRHLRRYAEAESVETRWLAESDAPSTLAFVATETGEPAFSFYGEGAADTLLTPPELPAALFDQTSILHVGSISLLRGTTPAAVLDACQRMAGRGLISLDPNVRPNLVNDEPAYRALLAQLTRLADVVKVSAADLAWLAPEAGMEEAAAALLAEGPGLVVVTHGGEGVLAFRDCPNPGGPPGGPRGGPPEAIGVPAFAVEVADTVGAGDAFDAGLLSWLGDREVTSRAALDKLPASDLREALRFAAAVAALNCTRAGADPPRRATVDAFMLPSERSGPDGEGENDDPSQ